MNTFDNLYFLAGGGEMGALIRAKDWKATPLGPPAQWPSSLRTAVAIMLENPFGMYIAWGHEYIQLYNDGYRPILGSTKHPDALGIGTRDSFHEIWHIVGPLFDDVMLGKATGFADFMFPLNRHGYVEECYFDFSYSPIRQENGEVGGVLVTVIETTNKKKAEDALKKSEERFRVMADNIPNLAWMADAEGYLFWYNKKWYDYTGTTPEQMAGWGWQSVHDPKLLPEVKTKWTASISSGEPFEMVFPLKGADGRFRQFLTRILPVRDPSGNIAQWFGTNTDITKQIEAEQSVKESEKRFRSLIQEASIPTFLVIGPDLIIALANPAMLEVFGKGQSVIGQPLEVAVPEIKDRELLRLLRQVYLTGKTYSAKEARADMIVDGERSIYYFDYTYKPLRNVDNDVYAIMGTAVNVTEQVMARRAIEESEQNLRNTILQAPVAMCILKGQNHVLELANERMYELWGKQAEVMINKPIFEGLPEARDQGFEKLLDNVYSSGESFSAQGLPITLPRKDKIETVFVNFVYAPYRQADGNVAGILAVAIDVTLEVLARQKIEEVVEMRTKELADANNDLRKSNDELAQFAYIASHDLQEPLRKISTFTQMLENSLAGKIEGQSSVYFSKIISASSRMNTLIRDVLTYSELVKGKEIFTAVNLNEVLQTNLVDYELTIEQKNVLIEYEELPVIQGIPLQLSQLFANLIGNALKFSRSDVRPHLRITAQNLATEEKTESGVDPTHDYIKLTFSDNGIGFEAEYANKIFEIFQRLHRITEFEGTGIGLAICKKIAINHGGDINAIGSSTKGAVFNVILPNAIPLSQATLAYRS